MPSKRMHYLVAERVAQEAPLQEKNRFKIGALWLEMSWRQDDSKRRTHYVEICEEKKGINWKRFAHTYKEKMWQDICIFGGLCHLITDGIWLREVVEPQIRAKARSKEERQKIEEMPAIKAVWAEENIIAPESYYVLLREADGDAKERVAKTMDCHNRKH